MTQVLPKSVRLAIERAGEGNYRATERGLEIKGANGRWTLEVAIKGLDAFPELAPEVKEPEVAEEAPKPKAKPGPKAKPAAK